jgi:hypothetical protein
MNQFPYKSCQRGTPGRKSLLHAPPTQKDIEERRRIPLRRRIVTGEDLFIVQTLVLLEIGNTVRLGEFLWCVPFFGYLDV